MKITIVAAIFSVLALASSAVAQNSVPVRFASGASGTTINGTIVGDEYIDYVLNARADQTMTAALTVTGTNGNGSAMFNIVPAGQDFPALYVGSMDDDNRADVVLPQDGDWAIRVYLMGNDRDTGKTVGFSIDVGVGGGSSAAGRLPEEDFFVVNLSDPGGRLNVRTEPRSGAGVMGTLANGTPVANVGGCTMSEGAQWCAIEGGGVRGWAAARFLRLPGPGASRRYILGASNGQFLYFRLAANGPGMSYQIFNPDGTFLLEMTGAETEYRGQLWQSGDHVIEVINRGSGAQSYNVIFGIE